ncbi:AAA family ATPase [Thiobacillus sp.]|uniref:ATP-binding protein n=1 Tax=Thiobacillus sp. TaxID=924 RepID=UPI0025D000AC|nr:AAA family ATPase [Thiobacillus sp.]MBT9538486.1 AAA family ATPase [Thiobacillus sp.]
MLITQFTVPMEDLQDDGLSPINMHKLGGFVALAGKNGAGKSRVLSKLEFYVGARKNGIGNVAAWQQQIIGAERAISSRPLNDPNQQAWKAQVESCKQQITIVTERIIVPQSLPISSVRFVPKNLNLTDPRNQVKANLHHYFNQASVPGLDDFENKCFSYIQGLQDREWESTHQRSTIAKDEVNKVVQEYAKLTELIEKLLKTQLGRSIDGNATIFGYPLAEAKLSDGQKVLFQLVVALHAQKDTLENTVFIMDEPENHLHPSALIEFLDALSGVAANCQFWIATHSVPLLSYVAGKEPMSIWYVEDGKVSNAGRHPETVLRGLLGDEEQVARLHDFTALPAQYAAINYSVESLLAPSVVTSGKDDPQVAQIGELIWQGTSERKISLLDFGAGKGRLLSGLAELLESSGQSIQDRIDYMAFDVIPDNRAFCEASIQTEYDTEIQRCFSSREEFFSHHAEECIDVTVLCNVLHEITPNEWTSIFNGGSLIQRAMKETGYLLIVEDQRIPTGEKAHQFGFLVLDTPHLRTLFSVTNDDCINKRFISNDYRKDGRLKAHLVSKSLLSRVTSETRRKAIEELKATAKDQIIILRAKAPSFAAGQMHGFWTQQFANASLFLEQA